MNNEPEQCRSLLVATAAHLAERGERIAEPYALKIIRVDGQVVRVRVESLGRVVEIAHDLKPATIAVRVGQGEDQEMLANAVALLRPAYAALAAFSER